jgi:hypothetical protein
MSSLPVQPRSGDAIRDPQGTSQASDLSLVRGRAT